VGEIRLGNHPSRSHLGARASGPQCIGCVWKTLRWRRARGSMGWPAVYRLRLEDTALASSTREYGPARSVWVASGRRRVGVEHAGVWAGPQCIGCIWKTPCWRRARGSMGRPAVYGLRLEGTGRRMNAIGGRFGTCPYCTPIGTREKTGNSSGDAHDRRTSRA